MLWLIDALREIELDKDIIKKFDHYRHYYLPQNLLKDNHVEFLLPHFERFVEEDLSKFQWSRKHHCLVNFLVVVLSEFDGDWSQNSEKALQHWVLVQVKKLKKTSIDTWSSTNTWSYPLIFTRNLLSFFGIKDPHLLQEFYKMLYDKIINVKDGYSEHTEALKELLTIIIDLDPIMINKDAQKLVDSYINKKDAYRLNLLWCGYFPAIYKINNDISIYCYFFKKIKKKKFALVSELQNQEVGRCHLEEIFYPMLNGKQGSTILEEYFRNHLLIEELHFLVDIIREKKSLVANFQWIDNLMKEAKEDTWHHTEEELPEDFVPACLRLGDKLITIAKNRIKKDSKEKELWQCLIEYIYSSHPQKKDVVSKLAV